MNSLEAFKEARWIMEQYHQRFVKEGIELKTIEGYPLDKIEQDLEILEILKSKLYFHTWKTEEHKEHYLIVNESKIEDLEYIAVPITEEEYNKLQEGLDQ